MSETANTIKVYPLIIKIFLTNWSDSLVVNRPEDQKDQQVIYGGQVEYNK